MKDKTNKKRMMTFQINEIEFQRLKAFAATKKISSSAMLRKLINDKYEKEQMINNLHYRLRNN